MASPEWPAPMMTVVTNATTLAPCLRAGPSVDTDEDVGRVRDDVEHGRALLRLGDQRLDVVLAGVGLDVEVDADGAEAVADLVIDAEDAVQVHVGLERGLDRMKLDAAAVGDGGNTGG